MNIPQPVTDHPQKYIAKGCPAAGGLMVVDGSWDEVITAASLFVTLGAGVVVIEVLREMKDGPL